MFVLSSRTKTRLLEKAMDMRTRVKLMLHFISIMKVQYYGVTPSSAHHHSPNRVVRLIGSNLHVLYKDISFGITRRSN